ncbi:hypothetical protein [Hyphomonas sp.]|uniref:hypothetical protein n=1 Tax=Hyphomonas sp. TaxID=87 RepID=UPI0025C6656B|nr:hypothetical protein [Hyphomonas sp.]
MQDQKAHIPELLFDFASINQKAHFPELLFDFASTNMTPVMRFSGYEWGRRSIVPKYVCSPKGKQEFQS